MPRQKSIVKIVKRFMDLSESERYFELADLMQGTADGAELAWRVKLVTALDRAGLYPQEKPYYADTSD